MSPRKTPSAELVSRLAGLGLTVVEPLSCFLSEAVVRVVDKAGISYIVKFSSDAALLAHECNVMSAFAKAEAAPETRLLDPHLLQMHDLGNQELHDDPAASDLMQIASMLQRAHGSLAPSSCLPLIGSHIYPCQQLILAGDVPDDLKQVAASADSRLDGPPVLLHADLHIKNLMITPSGPRMIDPYGMLGPAVYDLAMIAISYPEQSRNVFDALLEHYPAASLGIDVEAWYTWTAISRLEIALRHHFPTAPLRLHTAELAAEMYKAQTQ